MTDGNVRAEVSAYNTSIDVSFGTAYETGEGLSTGIIADKYDSTKTYAVGDYVIESKKLYRCITAVETAEAFDSTKWTLVKLANDVETLSEEVEDALINKMDKVNPTGTGSLSLNRKANTDIGDYSTAEGYNNEASGFYSHAEGGTTKASAAYAHAEGSNTTASGIASHAEGSATTASGLNSHAEGLRTVANHKSQHVYGEWNEPDTNPQDGIERGDYVEIVGNGTGSNNRSNARTLDWSGNETLAGNLIFNGSTSLSAEILRLDNRINNLPKGVNPKGTLGTSGTIQDLPTASVENEGYMYEVIEEGTYGGQASRVGDVFIGYNPPGTSTYAWLYIPSGDDDAYTRAQADAKFATKDEIKDTTITGALYHLGFYLDENGGLCQVNSI